MTIFARELARFPPPEQARVDEFGCWIWTGSLNGKGYGPHRQLLQAALGIPIPANLFPDHHCRRRSCCNPLHVELVTQGTNERRKSARGRREITRCPAGHRYIQPLVTPEGGMCCRVCLEEQECH